MIELNCRAAIDGAVTHTNDDASKTVDKCANMANPSGGTEEDTTIFAGCAMMKYHGQVILITSFLRP